LSKAKAKAEAGFDKLSHQEPESSQNWHYLPRRSPVSQFVVYHQDMENLYGP